MSDSLYQVGMKCPICGVDFKTSRVKASRCVVKSRDADFCTYYKGENPILYEAVVCPQCGYSSLYNSFEDISPDDARSIFEEVGRNWKKRDMGGKRSLDDALDAYKLVLYCSQLKTNKSHSLIASICLRLAWINRYKGKEREETRFIKYALQHYLLAYEQEKLLDKFHEITIIYLIGELNRRLRNYAEAIKWFGMVVSHDMRFDKPVIEKMAREQWSLARQQAGKEEKNG